MLLLHFSLVMILLEIDMMLFKVRVDISLVTFPISEKELSVRTHGDRFSL